jgi:hypothetical protein
MLLTNPFGILAGLASALIWGTGDFVGGVAASRSSQFKVLAVSALAGICVIIPAVIFAGESFPTAETIAWSLAAGISGDRDCCALSRACPRRGGNRRADFGRGRSGGAGLFGSLLESPAAPSDMAGSCSAWPASGW